MLQQEAVHFYKCMFNDHPTQDLIKNYISAHADLNELNNLPDDQNCTIFKIVKKNMNAVVIEPWLRKNGDRHGLSAKLLLVSYLTECGGGHSKFRRNKTNKFVFLMVVLKGFLGLFYGYYLKVRHGLV